MARGFSRSDVLSRLSKHTRERIVPLILRCLIHLEKIALPIHNTTSRTNIVRSIERPITISVARCYNMCSSTITVLDGRAALPANATAFKDLFTTIEQHVQFSIADNTTFSRSRVLHDFDMFAFEFE